MNPPLTLLERKLLGRAQEGRLPAPHERSVQIEGALATLVALGYLTPDLVPVGQEPSPPPPPRPSLSPDPISGVTYYDGDALRRERARYLLAGVPEWALLPDPDEPGEYVLRYVPGLTPAERDRAVRP